jgi:hypothetical protein
VDATATSGSGTQANPHGTISRCLATSKKYISVAQGTYAENLSISGKTVQIVGAADAPSPYSGGVPGVRLRSSHTSQAILVGSQTELYLQGMDLSPDSSTQQLVKMTSGARAALDRLLIRTIYSSIRADNGVQATSAHGLTMTDCLVTGMKKDGIQATETDMTLTRVKVEGSGGYGIRSVGSATKVPALTFKEVSATSNYYEGLSILRSKGTFDRIIVSENGTTSIPYSPGLFLSEARGSDISNLLSVYNGMGVVWYDVQSCSGFCPSTNVAHATVAFNKDHELHCPTAGSVTALYFTNSIVWDTSGTIVNGTKCSLSYSDVAGGALGTGNINTNPAFVAPTSAKQDFRLQKGSKCIDAGNSSIGLPKTDLAGKPRVHNGKVDMGAHEYQ